ncbi:MAG: capsid cement protein [Sphingomonadaceae bacterium]
MAYEDAGKQISLLAAANLSANQYHAVKIDGNGKVALAGAGEPAIGILQNKPAAGQAATVMVSGISKMVAGAAIDEGDLIAVDASGKAKAAVKGKTDTSDAGAAADPLIGSHVIGVAVTPAGADGVIFSVLLLHLGAVPTTAA